MKNVRVTDDLRIGGRLTMPRLEWGKICDSQKCDVCRQPLVTALAQHATTVVSRKGLGLYKIVCHKCLRQSIPEDKQDAFFKGRDPTLQIGE